MFVKTVMMIAVVGAVLPSVVSAGPRCRAVCDAIKREADASKNPCKPYTNIVPRPRMYNACFDGYSGAALRESCHAGCYSGQCGDSLGEEPTIKIIQETSCSRYKQRGLQPFLGACEAGFKFAIKQGCELALPFNDDNDPEDVIGELESLDFSEPETEADGETVGVAVGQEPAVPASEPVDADADADADTPAAPESADALKLAEEAAKVAEAKAAEGVEADVVINKADDEKTSSGGVRGA